MSNPLQLPSNGGSRLTHSAVNTLGYSRTITLALTAPPYLLCIVAITINGWHSDKKQERYLHIVCPFVITIVANVIAIATTAVAPRYVAMMLLPGSFYSASIVILSWISSSSTGPHVKRAVVYAIINSLCVSCSFSFGTCTALTASLQNTPNIWTSYLYFDAPRYLAAFGVDLAASVGVIICATATYLYLKRQNAKIERGEDLGVNGPSRVQLEAGFRYQL